MGDPKKTRKHFKRPLKIWDITHIEREKVLKEAYGLKNKREIWRTEAMLRKKRKSARGLLAMDLEERLKREKELLESLKRIGIVDEKATLDDVLTLKVESFLERRLQTVILRKGLANTAKQARQFITHGLIAINGKKVSAPGYIVKANEEDKLGYYANKKMVLRPAVKEEAKGKEPKKETLAEKFEGARPKAAPETKVIEAGAEVKAVPEKPKAEEKPKVKEAKAEKKPKAEEAAKKGKEAKAEETAEEKEVKE